MINKSQARALVAEMEAGQSDTVLLGLRIGLTLDEANDPEFRRLVARLWNAIEDKQRLPDRRTVTWWLETNPLQVAK